MAKLPAFQFYPGDWLKDPALRACSLAGRGLWMDMLCLMWESEQRGVLASNGKVWTDEMILGACGVTSVLLNVTLLRELLDLGVASRRDDGAVYCRRMVRDEGERTGTRLRVKKHRLAKRRNANVTPMKHASSSSSSSSDKKETAAQSSPATPAAPKTRKPHKRDSIWDAVVALWFPTGVSPTDKTRIGKVVRDLKAHGATDIQISDRLRRYRAEWPDSADTPEAIVKHWDRFATDKAPKPDTGGGRPPPVYREHFIGFLPESDEEALEIASHHTEAYLREAARGAESSEIRRLFRLVLERRAWRQ